MSGPRSRYASGDPSAGAPAEDLTAPTPPAPQSLASTATTASVTWTHAGAPGGTTYALTVVDDDNDEIAPDSGSGLGPWVIPVVSGRSYIPTITATGPDGQTSQSSALVQVTPDLAADFPLESEAGWRLVWGSDITTEAAQGPIPNGAGSITLSGDTIVTRGGSAGGAAFGTNNTCSVIPGQGIVLECLTTASMLPEVTLTIPLGETLTAENALRVSVKWLCYNEDGNDSGALYIADPAVTPTLEVAGTSDTGGVRIFGTTPTLTYRRGISASGSVSVPSGWGGGTPLYVEAIVPGYGNDAVLRVDDVGFKSATPDQRGRSQSAAAAPTTTATVWAEGISSIKIMMGVYNGGSGSGTPKGVIEAIYVEVR